MSLPPFLRRIRLRPDVSIEGAGFPLDLPFVDGLDVEFTAPVTYFVGENGSGKSTLLEAIAELRRLPVAGGGRNELADAHGPHRESELAPALEAAFARKPRDGYFFRAEFQAHFASLLEQRRDDPDFGGDPYARYGGHSLHTLSHGEAFLQMFLSWLQPGMILMDEPEAALSPQRQLAVLTQMARLARRGDVQMVIATHSPIFLTFPGAVILSFDEGPPQAIRLDETSHFQITRGILEAAERYWRELIREDAP